MPCPENTVCEGSLAMKRREFLLGSIASAAVPAAFAAEGQAEAKPDTTRPAEGCRAGCGTIWRFPEGITTAL